MSRHVSVKTAAGFTIIELMLATTVFAVALMVATAAVARITNMYYKGVISTQTQSAARSVTDEISRAAQFGGKDFRPGGTLAASPTRPASASFCIGDQRYSYAINSQVTDVSPTAADNEYFHALWRDTVPTTSPCTAADLGTAVPSGGTNGKELLDEHMRLTRLSITQPDPTNSPDLFQIDVGIIYGDTDLIEFAGPGNTNPRACRGGVTGAQWCASAELSTQVVRRLST